MEHMFACACVDVCIGCGRCEDMYTHRAQDDRCEGLWQGRHPKWTGGSVGRLDSVPQGTSGHHWALYWVLYARGYCIGMLPLLRPYQAVLYIVAVQVFPRGRNGVQALGCSARAQQRVKLQQRGLGQQSGLSDDVSDKITATEPRYEGTA